MDAYIAEPDPAYAYTLHARHAGAGFTAHVIDLTSQTWLGPEEVDRSVWKHWLTVVVPDEVAHDTGLLYISGGSNDSAAPASPNPMLAEIALATKSVTAELRMVPNQPLVFGGDGNERYEDELIAYGWDKFLRGGEVTWLARLPMTKAAVRAMDTITAYCADLDGGGVAVEKYVVAGASKRGWTTWTTGAADPRVTAIAPIVIDLLNLVPSFKHHWAAYGFWAPAVGDYEATGIMDWMDDPAYARLLDVVEPYSYLDRLTMPKFLINATGDQFFLPDSWKFYYDDLKGPKYLRYVPNVGHGLDGSDAHHSLAAFYAAHITGTPLPKYDWHLGEDGALYVTTEDTPLAVNLWRATNPETRDFRIETTGPVWKSAPLEPTDGGAYRASVPVPERGWTAFMVEVVFASPLPAPYKFTTGVHVVPDTMPFRYEEKAVESAAGAQ